MGINKKIPIISFIVLNTSLINHAQVAQVSIVLVVVHPVTNHKDLRDNETDEVSKEVVLQVLRVSLVEQSCYLQRSWIQLLQSLFSFHDGRSRVENIFNNKDMLSSDLRLFDRHLNLQN